MNSPGSHVFPQTHFPDFPLCDPLESSNFALSFSIKQGDTEEEILYKKLLSAACIGANVHDINKNLLKYPDLVNKLDYIHQVAPLHLASMKGHLNVVMFLLANGASVDIWNGGKSITPLICACAHNHVEVAKFLVNHGADVNTGLNDPNADTSLLWAVRRGHIELVKYLLEEGKASQTSLVMYSETPIHAAVTSGYPEILRMLIDAKGKPDLSMGDTRFTPLHLAASGEYPNGLECCKLLLDYSLNLNVNVADLYGRTPLHIAGISSSPDPDIVRILVHYGAEVDALDKSKRSPIFYFIRDSAYSLECMEILISLGKCDLNLQDESGYTVLHLAAFKEALTAAEILLMNGADFSLKAEGAGGVSGLSLLLRRLPSTSSILRKVLDNAVTLSGYDEKDNRAKSKQICKVKVNYNYVVSSSPSSSLRKCKPNMNSIDYVDIPITRAANEKKDAGSGTGTRRKNAKIWARRPKVKSEDGIMSHESEEGDDLIRKTLFANRKETSKIKSLIDENQSKLLLHPVIHSFLALKWQKARPIFISIFAFKFLLVLLFSGYVHAPYYMGKVRVEVVKELAKEMNDSNHSSYTIDAEPNAAGQILRDSIPLWYIILYSVIVFLAMINAIMEISQLIRSPKGSFLSMEPFIFLAVIIIMIFYTRPDRSWTKTDKFLHRTLAAAGIWLAWVDVWIYMGRFPAFGHSIRIFFSVLYNFIVFILPHFCLFIGFIFAFTLIFADNAEFGDLLHSTAKTVRVMAGDITFPLDKLNKGENESHTYLANLLIVYLYTAYIFTVGIVLMNLLIGLAVHDLQGIFKEASMHRLTKQTILLNALESNFSGKHVSRWVPKQFLKKYITLFHPTSQSKTLIFKPFDARDTKLNVDLKRALFKLKTDKTYGRNGRNASCNDFLGECKTCSSKREPACETNMRMEELVNQMETLLRKLEARANEPTSTPRGSYSSSVNNNQLLPPSSTVCSTDGSK